MAVSAQALTFPQYAVQSNSPLVQAITFSLIDNGSVLTHIPFATKQSLIANGVRWQGALPTVNWRKINTEPVVTSGTPTPYQEQAYIVSNAIDVDRFLVMDQNAIQDPRAVQLGAYLRSVAYDFNYKFLQNDPIAGDANAPVGLSYRIANPTVFGVDSRNALSASSLDITQATLATTPSNANTFLELLDQLLWCVGSNDGRGVYLYLNDNCKRRFATCLRSLGTSGGFKTVEDQFGRTVDMFRNAIVHDIGYKSDQQTRIITSTETSAGAAGSSNYTSIYAVRYDTDGGLMGWQFEPLESAVQDIGLIGNAGTLYRTIIDWAVGLYPTHTRCMARLYGLKMS